VASPNSESEHEQNRPKQGLSGARSALNKLRLPLRVGKGVQLAANLAKAKILLWAAAAFAVLIAVGLLFLIVVGMTAGMPTQSDCGASATAAADTLAPGGGIVVGASEYGGPGDPTTSGDKGAYIAHLTGHMAYAELGLSGSQSASKIGDALGLGKALAPHAKLQITANGRSVIAEKLDVGGGGGPVGSPPHERVIDLWYQTAAELGLDTTGSGQWSGLVTIKLVEGQAATQPSGEPVASSTEPTGGSGAPPQPQISENFIPFGQKRKDEMRAYSIRHYGIDSYQLKEPKVIVEHFTETTTWQEAYNTFAPDVPDSELHELPGTTSHFIIDQSGVIHQVLPLNLMGRHTVGLNYTAIGIEMVGMSDQEILNRPSELNAALALTRWLQWKYGISTSNVIGHNESLTSPFHHENIARLRTQTHSDWNKADMDIFRSKLAYEPSSNPTAVTAPVSAVGCEQEPEETGDTGETIVQIAQGQLGTKETGENCSPYGPCQPWCSDFLTWVWKRAGINIPRLSYSGEVYEWGETHTQVLPATATPAPGDAVEFGTGPKKSEHVGIVEKVFANGEILMISGNWNNEVARSQAFQPAQAAATSGSHYPIYGYVVP
jgi:beta-N-acetylhexosaminidase